MLTIEVFHTVFEDTPTHVASLSHKGTVSAALEAAYCGTQNLDTSWVHSKGQNGITVEPMSVAEGKSDGCRSTAVGDYARVLQDGRESFWRCGPMGWKEIKNRSDLMLVRTNASMAAYRM